jgi:hypothetical protein
MKTRDDYEFALAVVSDAVRHWDPCSLLANGAPEDEFSNEVAAVVTHIPRIHSQEDAAYVLSTIFSEAFQAEGFSIQACASAAESLFNALVHAGLVRAQQTVQPDVPAFGRPAG